MANLVMVFAVVHVLSFSADAAWIPTTETVAVSSADRNEAMNYLRKYGYMTRGLMPNDVNAAEQTLREAIKRMQSFFGLPITGEINDELMNLVQTPRCGLPDLGYFENLSRKKRYDVFNEYIFWDPPEVTYTFTKYTTDSAPAVIESEVAKAFQEWHSVIPVDFRHVTSGPADIEILFDHGDHGDSGPWIEGTLELAHAFYPRNGDIHFNDAYHWWNESNAPGPVNYQNKMNLYVVALHEIGHSLGLNHSQVRNSIMWPYIRYYPDRKLDPDDVEGIQHIYGREFCPDETIVCEGKDVIVRCPPGSTVKIQNGMFGRLDFATCASEPIAPPMMTNCTGDATAVTHALRARCDGRSACKVYGGNSYLQGDPCPDTIKYLKFCYTCVSG